MNPKGDELRPIITVPTVVQRDLFGNQLAVKPVEKGSKANVDQKEFFKKGGYFGGVMAEFAANEEDARLAAEIMAEHLSQAPELESDWQYDKEENALVIVVKNKKTGEILRQIPPEEIISGDFIPDIDSNGNIINKIA